MLPYLLLLACPVMMMFMYHVHNDHEHHDRLPEEPHRVAGKDAIMSHDSVPAYGLWGLLLINTVVFVGFAFSFFKPSTARDRRASAGPVVHYFVSRFTQTYT